MSKPLSSMHDDESVMGQAYDARLMKRLLGCLKPYVWTVVAAVLLLLLVTAAELAGPLIIKTGIDEYISPRRMGDFGWVVAAYLALLAAGFVLRYYHLFITQWLGQKVVYDLRVSIFDHLQRLDVKFIDAKPVGWLMTRVTGDIQTLNEMFTSGVVSVFGDIFALVGIAVIMLILDWKLALVAFTVLPPLVWVVFRFRQRVRVTFRVIREALARLNGFIQEHISGIRTVQLFRREVATLKDFERKNAVFRAAYLKAIRYYAVFFPTVNFLSALSVALILLTGGLMIRESALTWGALVAFIQYAERFFRPIRDLSERYNTMQAAMAAAERVFWVLDSRAEVVKPLRQRVIAEFPGRVEFDRVSFEYIPGEPVLQDVSFRVNPGETVAIVGPTGAGKTTLISLLLRFWDVKSGAIRVDGADIREYDPAELRRAFGVVHQDVFLFSGSIADNVTLGEPCRNDTALKDALTRANALEFVEALPHGVNELVGERGARLSGGQKQLIAIARALAADPPLLLLDEATAAVDTETELRIQDALDRLMEGRTTIVVAHRLSTIRRAHRIIVLHHGRLREMGTHTELMDRGGIYAKLYRLQFAEVA